MSECVLVIGSSSSLCDSNSILPSRELAGVYLCVFSVEGEDEDDDDDSDNANIWVLLLHLLLQCFVQSFSSFSESSISSKALVILLILLLPSSFPR